MCRAIHNVIDLGASSLCHRSMQGWTTQNGLHWSQGATSYPTQSPLHCLSLLHKTAMLVRGYNYNIPQFVLWKRLSQASKIWPWVNLEFWNMPLLWRMERMGVQIRQNMDYSLHNLSCGHLHKLPAMSQMSFISTHRQKTTTVRLSYMVYFNVCLLSPPTQFYHIHNGSCMKV